MAITSKQIAYYLGSYRGVLVQTKKGKMGQDKHTYTAIPVFVLNHVRTVRS